MTTAPSRFRRIARIVWGVVTFIVGLQLLLVVGIALMNIASSSSHNDGWLGIALAGSLCTIFGIAFCVTGVRLIFHGKGVIAHMRVNKPTVGLIAVLVIVAGCFLSPVAKFKLSNSAKSSFRVHIDLQVIRTALRTYKMVNGNYPSTQEGLMALATRPVAPQSSVTFLPGVSKIPKDPWHNDYVYRCPGRINRDSYDLFSAGPDGMADTADDDWGK